MHRRAHNHLKSAGSERNEKEGGGREEMCPAGAREARAVRSAATSELRSVPPNTLAVVHHRDTPYLKATSMHFSIAKNYTLFLSNIQSTEALLL